MIRTLDEARQAGHQWAADRRRTGSTWSHFLLEDALGSVDLELPEGERRSLAHEVCAAASARTRETAAGWKP